MRAVVERVEHAVNRCFDALQNQEGPPGLGAAIRYAVFPGGARFRPRLCTAVAIALGDPAPELTDAAAVAVELVHCGSLVHDDLPCFDDAAVRRGKPSLHAAFGEPTAVLAGDALIAMSFQALAAVPSAQRERALDLVLMLSRSIGHPFGIIAGQAWENETCVSLATYHDAKSASLFEAACAMGAIAAGSDPAAFRQVGRSLGLAYQIADDLADGRQSEETMGKAPGMDARNGRPNALLLLGEDACKRDIERHVAAGIHAVPACVGQKRLQAWIRASCRRFIGQPGVLPRLNAASRAPGSRSSAATSD